MTVGTTGLVLKALELVSHFRSEIQLTPGAAWVPEGGKLESPHCCSTPYDFDCVFTGKNDSKVVQQDENISNT